MTNHHNTATRTPRQAPKGHVVEPILYADGTPVPGRYRWKPIHKPVPANKSRTVRKHRTPQPATRPLTDPVAVLGHQPRPRKRTR